MTDLLEKVCGRVVGRRREILMIVAALEAGKHLFLEGPPGTSKSTILQAVGECTGRPVRLVTGNSDLTTAKLVGYFDPAEVLSHGYRQEFFHDGPLLEAMREGMYLYIEEFNRLPDETTNVFVTVMSEGKLTVPRLGEVAAADGFRIIAALNPLDDIGINRISRALKDRFTSLRLDYQPREEELEIVRLRTGCEDGELVALAVDIARETRRHPDLKLGASVRGSIDMVDIYNRSRGLLPREGSANPSDGELLRQAAQMAFRNRIWLYDTGEKREEEIIDEILARLQRQKKK